MKAYLRMDPKALSGFSLELQKGMQIWFQTGCSIKELVYDQLGIPEDYLESRIQTIFLNGKVVDKPEASTLQAGDTLSLSAAMPGLAGTTLRRGGHLGAFRGGITHNEQASDAPCHWDKLTIKVFNLLIQDLGPVILKRGVNLGLSQAENLFKTRPASFWELCLEAKVRDEPLETQRFADLSWLAEGQEAELKVEFAS